MVERRMGDLILPDIESLRKPIDKKTSGLKQGG